MRSGAYRHIGIQGLASAVEETLIEIVERLLAREAEVLQSGELKRISLQKHRAKKGRCFVKANIIVIRTLAWIVVFNV